MGNLTRDPELRHTAAGTAVANMSLAVNRWYKAQNGETKKEAEFFTVVAWARQAETCSQYLQKGNPIFVEGRLTTNSWEGKDGQKRSRVEVVAERIQFLSKSPSPGSARAFEEEMPATEEEETSAATTSDSDEIPF